MERKVRVVQVVVTLLCLCGTVRPAEACSCITGTPLCESFWKTPVVFSGEVLEIASGPLARSPDAPLGLDRVVRFRVEQSWRGEVSGEVVVRTGSGGGDCGYKFERGVRYLVYAHHRAGVLSTGICQRTRPISKAAEDFQYFKTAFKPRAVGRVFGRATYQRTTPDVPIRPIAGYPVTLSNAQKTWSGTTDADGRYQFDDVPAGKYSVRLGVPDTEHAYGKAEVELADPRGCAAADFHVVSDGRISAAVVDAGGRPARDVRLELVDLETLQSQDRFPSTLSAQTDADGRAAWQRIAPGRYVIGLNVTRGPDAKQPYSRMFYPGVTDLTAARVIDLAAGERLELETLILPAPLRQVAISGVVVWPDGKPAAQAPVSLEAVHDGRGIGSIGATTDADGRFTVSAYFGQRYRLSAFSRAASGKTQFFVRSADFEVSAETQPMTLKLTARSSR